MAASKDTPARAITLDEASGSQVLLADGWLEESDAEELLADLRERESRFEGGHHLVEGRKVPTPRMVLSFGDDDFRFADIGASLSWPESLRAARDRLAAEAGHPFNYALANWYRDGADFTGWHSDKIEHHVESSEIAILSLGATRDIAFRPIGTATANSTVALRSGSLMWMSCELQKVFEHAVPKDKAVDSERFSVTFRYLRTDSPAT